MMQGFLRYTAKVTDCSRLPFERLTVSGDELASLNDPASLLVDDCMIYGMEVFADQSQGTIIIEVAFQGANSPEGTVQICDEAADRFVNNIAFKYGVAAELIPMADDTYGIFHDVGKDYS